MEGNYLRPVGFGCGKKWPKTEISFTSSINQRTPSNSITKRLGKESDSFGRNRDFTDQKSYRNSPRLRFGGRVLLTHVCGPQKVRRPKTCVRSKSFESTPVSPTLQDGILTVNKGSVEQRGICSISGHERCLLPHTSPPPVQKIPNVLHSRHMQNSLSLPSYVLRASLSPADFYQGLEGTSDPPETPGHLDPPLPRRLASEKQMCRDTQSSNTIRSKSGRLVRDPNQPEEVILGTQTNLRIPRSSIQPSRRTGFSHRAVHSKSSAVDSVSEKIQEGHSQELPLFSGPSQLFGRLNSPGASSLEASPVLPQVFLQGSPRPTGQGNSPRSNIFSVSGLVESPRQSDGRRSTTSPRAKPNTDNRCELERLGGSCRDQNCFGSVVTPRIRPAHQSSRDESSHSVSQSILHSCPREMHKNTVRQCNGSFLYKTSRRDTVSESVPLNSGVIPVLPTTRNTSQGCIYTRETECTSRQSQSQRADFRDRMDSSQPNFHANSAAIPIFTGRSVCNIQKQATSSVCQSVPRQSSLGSGCHVSGLGRIKRVRFSTQSSDSRHSEESEGVRLHSSVSSPGMASTDLVPGTIGTTSGISPGFANSEADVEPTRVSDISHEARIFEPTRVGYIKQSLLQEGFSEKAASRASQPQRKSSLSVYESHFQTFLRWLSGRGRTVESVSIPLIADYFVHMFEELGRSTSTISNHRSALSVALGTFDGFTVGNHPVLTALLKNCALERPPQRNLVPEWDLLKVLNRLTEAPFEPPKFDTLVQKLYCTWKTVFLLALASTKRASELHAISREKKDLVFARDGVYLRTVPGFLAKTQAASSDSKPFFIPRHDLFSGRDNPDRLLCPVRMLKFYLHYTNGKGRLFQKCRGEGSVCAKTISSWLKNLIKFVYKDTTNEQVSARGHEVRKMSASWAFAAGVSIEEILLAGSWARTSTFTSHYLVDVQRQVDGSHRLHPTVAGKKTH